MKSLWKLIIFSEEENNKEEDKYLQIKKNDEIKDKITF
jgi:hypothetical protein